jgi:hypothetical protein
VHDASEVVTAQASNPNGWPACGGAADLRRSHAYGSAGAIELGATAHATSNGTNGAATWNLRMRSTRHLPAMGRSAFGDDVTRTACHLVTPSRVCGSRVALIAMVQVEPRVHDHDPVSLRRSLANVVVHQRAWIRDQDMDLITVGGCVC